MFNALSVSPNPPAGLVSRPTTSEPKLYNLILYVRSLPPSLVWIKLNQGVY